MTVSPTVLGGVLGAIILLCAVCAIETIILIGDARRLLVFAEQLLTVGRKLLAEIPGKSAPRTDAGDDAVVPAHFSRLRLLADLRDRARELSARVGAGPDTTVKDALTVPPAVSDHPHTDPETSVDDTPTDTFPAVPATEPAQRIDVAGGLRVPTEDQDTPEQPPAPVDDVDRQLARWGLRTTEGRPA